MKSRMFLEKETEISMDQVKFDPISGNYICIAYGIVIHFNTAEIIDLQQSISDLL